MRKTRPLAAGLALAPLLALAPATGADGGGGPARALPDLDREALLRCMDDERRSRELLERRGEDRAAIAASADAIDAQRRELEALRARIDPGDAQAVERYNARAARFDTEVRRHNEALAALEARREEQRTVARRYNANCAGRHFRPHVLRAVPLQD
jgi:hypothetical protein